MTKHQLILVFQSYGNPMRTCVCTSIELCTITNIVDNHEVLVHPDIIFIKRDKYIFKKASRSITCSYYDHVNVITT